MQNEKWAINYSKQNFYLLKIFLRLEFYFEKLLRSFSSIKAGDGIYLHQFSQLHENVQLWT
ncbi:hypothetical protein LguiA_001954 [Lonicera macranthoides]